MGVPSDLSDKESCFFTLLFEIGSAAGLLLDVGNLENGTDGNRSDGKKPVESPTSELFFCCGTGDGAGAFGRKLSFEISRGRSLSSANLCSVIAKPLIEAKSTLLSFTHCE